MNQKIIDKIVKLRALAQSDNLNEANAAAAAAAKLIAEYRIAEADLDIGQECQEKAERHSDPLCTFGQRITYWRGHLAHGIAKIHGCSTIYNSRRNPFGDYEQIVEIFGRKSDVDTVRYLFAWLVAEITRLCERHGKGQGKAWRTSYCTGAVAGVLEAMRGAETTARVSASSTAIVRLDRTAQEAREAMRAAYPKTKSASGGSVSDGGAYGQGKNHGRSIHQRSYLPTKAGNRLLGA
jgi:hypothetical protein